ncbi:DUF3467 domain-containing protein [Nanoarchaeota archaeon]
MEKKQTNVIIDNGKEMFSHEMSINFNPLQFILDFRCVTPRTDLRSREQNIIQVRHNTIMVDPFHAKQILNLLARTVQDFEQKYGEIKKPEPISKFEEEMKKRGEEVKKESEKETDSYSYFG